MFRFRHPDTCDIPAIFMKIYFNLSIRTLPPCSFGTSACRPSCHRLHSPTDDRGATSNAGCECYRTNPQHFAEVSHSWWDNLPKSYYELKRNFAASRWSWGCTFVPTAQSACLVTSWTRLLFKPPSVGFPLLRSVDSTCGLQWVLMNELHEFYSYIQVPRPCEQ